MKITPAMQQFKRIKADYPDSILFFRMGDFYEMFYEDAITASKVLNIVLTSRNKGENPVPMCGIPYHAVDNYLPKLIKAGYKVAVCEQLEEPKKGIKVVKRDVVRIITPGTAIDDTIINENNNWLTSISVYKDIYGIASADLSTGEIKVTEIKAKNRADILESIRAELLAYSPSEILLSEGYEKNDILKEIFDTDKFYINLIPDWLFDYSFANTKIKETYRIKSLEGFGISGLTSGIVSVGILIHYLTETQKEAMKHLKPVSFYSRSDFMVLDEATLRNLELLTNRNTGDESNTLFSVINFTKTAMGKRKLKTWLIQPLVNKNLILERNAMIKVFIQDTTLSENIEKELYRILDIERLTARIALARANPKNLLALASSLKSAMNIISLIRKHYAFAGLTNSVRSPENIISLIETAIREDAPIILREGNIIKHGYSSRLDELIDIREGGKDWIKEFEKLQKDTLKVSTLRVRYNKVFGYYIEIPKTFKNIPKHYQRKQTLVNYERYTTDELRNFEERIITARDESDRLEYEIFNEICEKISKASGILQEIAGIIAYIDIIYSLSRAAIKFNFSEPHFNDNDYIDIKNGWHPVIAACSEEEFIKNDTLLNNEQRLYIITGPNMAGKSTYIRQTALIVLMAQIGSYVPAEVADLHICDKIFTRVGASDNLVRGESTFLVEMNETANILNNATKKSLVILDEIGRGTATYDGLSLAWAILEQLLNIGAKSLFATHYHELTVLEKIKGVVNYNIMVKEWNNKIIFLRKVVKGAASRSYGIQVARLAGIPEIVIKRAMRLLDRFETEAVLTGEKSIENREDADQLNLFGDENKLVFLKERLREIDINNTTPLQALDILLQLKNDFE